MKKIFNFGKKGQSSSSRFNLPSFFGSQPVYRTQGYLIQSKDLGKIHKAALRGDVVKVQQLLLLGKNTVNELDKMKRTPLHLACANGYPDVVSLLIERKCELDLLDNDNKTPLMKDMIRKLQQELADSQKEESILSQKALEMKQLLKIYQMESEDMIRKLQQELADSQKEESMLSQKALEMKQLLKIYQMESEDMIRKLQQELADSQKEESMLSQKALEMKQLLKIYQMESELQESQEQKRETQQYNELEEHMQKFKMECATFENSGEQDENIWETINFYFKHIQDLKRQLDAAFSKFMQLELMNKIIQEESFSSKSLQKNHDKLERKKRNLKKLIAWS
ncbi:uncharacterized protein LOC141544671 isoform X2 [Sminthopsis crassicaudata]|uniref:uncharacterized protein LOC141544671 isoform X2 n=1 Tax=Sminthopsis crassicaudata TaxID=9301 RepID=UPI003D699B01